MNAIFWRIVTRASPDGEHISNIVWQLNNFRTPVALHLMKYVTCEQEILSPQHKRPPYLNRHMLMGEKWIHSVSRQYVESSTYVGDAVDTVAGIDETLSKLKQINTLTISRELF